jgi:hypothetical protein
MNIVQLPVSPRRPANLGPHAGSAGALAAGALAAFAAAADIIFDYPQAEGTAGLILSASITVKATAAFAAGRALAITASGAAGEGGADAWRRCGILMAVIGFISLIEPTILTLINTAGASDGARVLVVRITGETVVLALASTALFAAARLSAKSREAQRALEEFI